MDDERLLSLNLKPVSEVSEEEFLILAMEEIKGQI